MFTRGQVKGHGATTHSSTCSSTHPPGWSMQLLHHHHHHGATTRRLRAGDSFSLLVLLCARHLQPALRVRQRRTKQTKHVSHVTHDLPFEIPEISMGPWTNPKLLCGPQRYGRKQKIQIETKPELLRTNFTGTRSWDPTRNDMFSTFPHNGIPKG
jgi:hypothetical protein